jgi:TRAP-type C4-dicarboxylate transport system permease small subunit
VIAAYIGRLEKILGVINGYVLRLCRWLALTLLATMTAIVLSSVFFRYVLNDALAWSEEIAKFLMVWMTFIAAPLALKAGALVAIEALPNALRGRARDCLVLLIQLAIISLMVAFVDRGSFLAQNAYIQRASTINISILYVYIAMPLGALFILMLSVETLLGAMRRIFGGKDEPQSDDPPDEDLSSTAIGEG